MIRSGRPAVFLHAVLLGLAAFAVPARGAQDETAKDLEAKAAAAAKAGELEQAHALLLRAVALSDASRDTRFALARVCVDTGRTNDAMDLLDALDAGAHEEIRIPRLWVEVIDKRIVELGANANRTVLMRKQDLRDHLARIVQMDGKDHAALGRLLETCMELGDRENLARWGTWARTQAPDRGEGYVADGDLIFLDFLEANSSGNEEAAKTALEEARKRYTVGARKVPGDPICYERLGRCAEWAGDGALAATEYAKALALDPTCIDVAAVSGRLGANAPAMLEAAVDALDSGKASHGKDDALLRYYAGWYLSYAKEDGAKKGVEQLLKAVEANPEYHDCWYSIGIKCSYDLRDYDRAAMAFARLGELGTDRFASFAQANGGDPKELKNTLEFLIVTMSNKSRFDLCRGLQACIVSLEPRSPDAWQNYAFFCRESREYERSLQAYERALGLAPEDPAILNDTALILHFHLFEREGAMKRAEEMYEKAIRLAKVQLEDPKLDEARADVLRVALRDATNNLAMAKKGIRRRG